MKKIFTLIMTVACSALTAWATDYTGNLAVVVNDSPADPQQTTIIVNQQTDGKYELQLNNFSLVAEGDEVNVGNIVVKDVEAQTVGNVTNLVSKQVINISAGSDKNIDWFGPLLGDVPVELTATITDGILKAIIDIPFDILGMKIKVFFSSAVFQIPNSDFELFHKENNFDEPNHWHSFGCAVTTMWTSSAKNQEHTFVSPEVRPDATGKSSVLVKATKILGIVANGTITTGRMNAGSVKDTSTDNHAFLDLSNTDKDNNGDPYYTVLNGRPDAVKVWVKFKQATAQASYPYATVNAVITDGTRYQDPEDKTYTNVVAKATNAKIETNDFAWQELTIPFKYEETDVEGKAILVTISTNATPGKGSNGDELYVDDLSLVYNAGLANLSVFGTPVSGFTTDNTTYAITVDKLPTASDIVATPLNTNAQTAVYIKDKTVTVITFGEDLMSSKSYILNLTVNTGIEEVKTADNQQVTGIYNLNGQRVNEQVKGQVYITKYADGSTVKTIGK